MADSREAGASFGEEQKERFLAHRMVAKIGSKTITGGGESLDLIFVDNIARQVSELHRGGVDVVIVSSGAVVSGKSSIPNFDKTDILHLRKAAAVGQPKLMTAWTSAFEKYGIKTGQVIVTENDLPSARDVLMGLLEDGIVPIVNANDSVNKYEIEKLSTSADNDRLAGFVAREIEADTLLLLTDRDGVVDEEGETISYVDRLEHIEEVITEEGDGKGGMWIKAVEAHGAAGEGRFAVVAYGRTEDVVLKAAKRVNVGTRFITPFMIY